MTEAQRVQLASYILAGVALLAVLQLNLLTALLAGLLIFHLVELGARGLRRIGILPHIGKVILLVIIMGVFVAAISFGVVALVAQMTRGPEGVGAMMHTMADVVGTARAHMPLWIQNYLPANVEEWQAITSDWLRDNAKHLSVAGRDIGMFLTHLIIGMIIGGLVALSAESKHRLKPLSEHLHHRTKSLASAFRRIVFSQIRISALNTILTGIFLIVVLPSLDMPLPFAKTLVAVTFIAGLLPIIGNLISNTAITLVALSVSLWAAVAALGFLIVIHKLEYFINARIIGSQIHAKAWELLVAMLVMESAFGLPGVVAAPIFYAYLKEELSSKDLV